MVQWKKMAGPRGARRRNCTSVDAFLAALVVLALALRHAWQEVVELQGKLEALGKPQGLGGMCGTGRRSRRSEGGTAVNDVRRTDHQNAYCLVPDGGPWPLSTVDSRQQA